MEGTILVTGATGNLGREVVKALVAKGYAVRAATRTADKVTETEAVTAVRLDYSDATTFDAALKGAEGLFLVAPPMDPEAPAKLGPLIEKAKATGIGHIVFTSAFGMDQNEQAPLRIIERVLMDSGVNCTILRPNFFMENFSTGLGASMINRQNGIFLAAGDGKTSFISTKDIADVAAIIFAESRHGKAYNLTGPEALDHSEVARKISEAAGREITYHALDEAAMLQGARDQRMPEGAVQYMGVLYGAVRAGYTAAVTADVQNVTGRKPVTFDHFAKANAACWRQKA